MLHGTPGTYIASRFMKQTPRLAVKTAGLIKKITEYLYQLSKYLTFDQESITNRTYVD